MENKQLGLVFVAIVAMLPVFFGVGFYLGLKSAQPTASEKSIVAGPERRVPGEEDAEAAAKPTAMASDNTQMLSGKAFLQAAAVTQGNAEALRGILTNNGFQVRLSPVPGQNLVRVLVGPVENHEELDATRAALGKAGFESFLRRY